MGQRWGKAKGRKGHGQQKPRATKEEIVGLAAALCRTGLLLVNVCEPCCCHIPLCNAEKIMGHVEGTFAKLLVLTASTAVPALTIYRDNAFMVGVTR